MKQHRIIGIIVLIAIAVIVVEFILSTQKVNTSNFRYEKSPKIVTPEIEQTTISVEPPVVSDDSVISYAPGDGQAAASDTPSDQTDEEAVSETIVQQATPEDSVDQPEATAEQAPAADEQVNVQVMPGDQADPTEEQVDVEVMPVDQADAQVESESVESVSEEVVETDTVTQEEASDVPTEDNSQVAQTDKSALVSGYVIQLASFQTEQSAHNLVTTLQKNSISAFVYPIVSNNKDYYRVYVGPKPSTDMLRALQPQLQTITGEQGFVVRYDVNNI